MPTDLVDTKLLKSLGWRFEEGHFDVEINKGFLKEYSEKITEISSDITEYLMHGVNRVYLLSEGSLVNLAAAEGHPSEVMDMSFANQILGLKELVEHPLIYKDNRVYNIPRSIDERVAELKLDSMDIMIDKETDEQVNYRMS